MGQFFKQTLASLLGTLLGIAIFLGVGTGTLLVFFLILASQDGRPAIGDKSYLVIDLATPITDSSQPRPFRQILAGNDNLPSLTLREFLEAIEAAASDKRIAGIFLDGRKPSSGRGYATSLEMRDALKQFRAKGKPILAYDTDLREGDYFLTSVADKIVLNPMGSLEMNGLASQQAFFTGALEKYGIGVQVIRVGSFKAAVEPFIRKNFSPENQVQLQSLLEDIWQTYLQIVAEGRSLPPQKLQAIADGRGLLSAQTALQEKLIDRVAYFDEVLADLKQKTDSEGEKTFRQIALSRYVTPPSRRSGKAKIAILYAEGAIVEGKSSIGQIGGDDFSREIRKLRQNEDIKAVILRINSPGGSATASDVILREVQLTQTEKPVIVSMGNVAASGGYWIATGGNRIFASPNSLTGSIGVFGLLFNLQDIAQNNGITFDTVKTGALANLTTAARPKTPAELAIYQQMVNQVYDLFLDKVARARKMPKEKVAALAQGRVWSGEDAMQVGLVDEMGGLLAALKYGIKVANLEGQAWSLEEYPKNRTLEALIAEQLSNTRFGVNDLPNAEFLRWQRYWQAARELNDPQGIYSRMFLNWNFE